METPGEARFVAHAGDWCGEGICWCSRERALYWVDNRRNLVHRYEPGFEIRTWQFDETVASLAVTTERDILCIVLGSKLMLLNVRTNERQSYGCELKGWPDVRYNDSGVDPEGALWIGSMANNLTVGGDTRQVTPGQGHIFRLNANKHLTTMLSGIGVANTLIWSPGDVRFYTADSLHNRIVSYAFERGTGGLHGRQPLLEDFPRGRPDGSAVDEEGSIWNCRYDGACVVRISSSGVVQQTVEMPTQNVTSCAFGGDDMRTLFVTTAVSERRQTAADGGLFAIRTDVKGKSLYKHRIQCSLLNATAKRNSYDPVAIRND